MNCDECEATMINGLFCHERGCPNVDKTWSGEAWVRYLNCSKCGYEVEEGEHCDCMDVGDEEDEE